MPGALSDPGPWQWSCVGTIDSQDCNAEQGGKELCGDGILQGGEQCDDANVDDTDGCHNDCTSNLTPAEL